MFRTLSITPFVAIRLFAVLAAVFGVLSATLAQAQGASEQEGEWSQTALTVPATELFTPASGALFAVTSDGLSRSDDGGTSWRTIPLPAPLAKLGGRIVVDPANHATIYVVADDGLYKTEDDAATWRLIVPTDPQTPLVLGLAVSPAASNVVYLALSQWKSGIFIFKRSLDGGATWETVESRENNPHVICYWAFPLLQPHPIDPNRVFRAGACEVRGQQAVVEGSRDQGVTWTEVYKPQLAHPHTLVGAAQDQPGRLLVAMNKDDRGGGSRLIRSDDDGVTWTHLLDYSGGGGMSGGGPNVRITGLAIDPTWSDRLLVSVSASTGTWAMPAPLKMSQDGGASWTDVSPSGMGSVRDVAIGIDGRMMFAAAQTGVWRATTP